MPKVIRSGTGAAGFSCSRKSRARYAKMSNRLPRRSGRSAAPPAGVPSAAALSAGPLPAAPGGVRVAAAARPAGRDTLTGVAAARAPAALPPAVENAAREVLGIIAADHPPPPLTSG